MKRNPDIDVGYCHFCDEPSMCFRFDDLDEFSRDGICLDCLLAAKAMLENELNRGREVES